MTGDAVTVTVGGSPWSLTTSTTAVDTCILWGIFNGGDMPAPGDFTSNDVIVVATTTATGAIFAGSETGISVAPAATRTLWFKFASPSETTIDPATEQSIKVTVSAGAP